MSSIGFDILVCSGPECAGVRHADSVYGALIAAVEERALAAQVEHGRRKCFGRCQRGPNVYVRARKDPHRDPAQRPPSALYNGVDVVDVDDILTSHVLGGIVVTRLIQRQQDVTDELADLTEDPSTRSESFASPGGGDPTGTGRDVRLAVAMHTLNLTSDAESGLADDPSPPTIETTENG